MPTWTGEPAVDGLFSDFIGTNFEFGNKKYGRTSPVLDHSGSIALEPGEEIRTTFAASEIVEFVDHGPAQSDGSTARWSQRAEFAVAITNVRLFFSTDDLPINMVQRMVLKRHGTKHAGHVRWGWVALLASDDNSITVALPADETARDMQIVDEHVRRFYRRGLRITLGDRTAEVADVLDLASTALTDERLGWNLPADEREALRSASTSERSERAFPHHIPHPYKSLEEYLRPELTAARESSRNIAAALREIDKPLITQPLKPAEERRIKKAMQGYMAGEGDPRGVRRWMYDLDPSYLAELVSGTDIPPAVRGVLAEHPSPKIAEAIDQR